MEQNPTTVNQEATEETVAHEVDSNYTKRDIKIPHEKKHTGLIVGIILAVLVAVCGGLALWFFCWYSNPDQVAYDAVNNLIKAENVSLEGGFTIINPDEDSTLKMVLISFDSASSHLPSSTSAKIQFIFNQDQVEGDPRVLIEAKNVVMRDGVVYLQIGGIMESINSLGIDDDSRESIEVFLNTLEVIDNEWWQISIPDLIDVMELPETQSDAVTGVYQCAVQAMNRDDSGDIATIYKQNQFIEIKSSKQLAPDAEAASSEVASGHKAYELTLNKAKLASFVNRMPETNAAKEFFACYNGVAQKYGGETIDISDIEEISEDDIEWPDAKNLKIFLEISQWDHRLRSVYVFAYGDDGQDVGGGSVMFKYDNVAVTPPDSYRPITELFDELAEIFSQFFAVPAEDYEEM